MEDKGISHEDVYGGDYGEKYAEEEEVTFCIAMKCFQDCGMFKKKQAILEIACASGLHAVSAAQTMMSDGSLLVVTDLNKNFVQMANGRFERSHFTKTPGNAFKYYEDSKGKAFTAAELKGDSNRSDAIMEASACELPFADGQFDAVSANGVLFILPEPMKAFAEISRVLKKGGKLVLTHPPDRPFNDQWKDSHPKLDELFGHLSCTSPGNDSLIEDKAKFEADLKNLGFKKPRYSLSEEYSKILTHLVDIDCEMSCGDDKEKKKEMRQKAKDIFLEHSNTNIDEEILYHMIFIECYKE